MAVTPIPASCSSTADREQAICFIAATRRRYGDRSPVPASRSCSLQSRARQSPHGLHHCTASIRNVSWITPIQFDGAVTLLHSPESASRRIPVWFYFNLIRGWKMHTHDRPLSWAQIKALRPIKATAERPPDFPSSDLLSFYVQAVSGVVASPRVEVESLSAGEYGVGLARVRVDMPNTVVAHLPGRRVHHLELPPRGAATTTHRSVDSFRPPWIDATFLPATAPRPQLPRIFAKGRKVRPLYVGPDDRRQILTDTSYPWLLTGKIFTSDGTSGSGVLVGDRVALTARHVVPWTSIAAGNWWMKFVPAYFDGREPFGSSYVSDVSNYGRMTPNSICPTTTPC